MKLVDVYSLDSTHILYELLTERTQDQSISHKEIPSMEDHRKFIQSRPYRYWYLIYDESGCVGAVYLSKLNEIGIGIFIDCRGNGYAKEAVKKLMELHPGKFLANINPRNKASIKLFEKLGFKKLQVTYAKS